MNADRDQSEPPAKRQYGDAIGSLVDQTKRLAKAGAEVTALRAKVAHLEAAVAGLLREFYGDGEPCSNVACVLPDGHGGGCRNPAIDPPGSAPTFTRPRAVAAPADVAEPEATVYASMEHDREIHTPDSLEWPSKEDA